MSPKPSRPKTPTTAVTGPLRVHPTNGRYFTDGSGRAVYLAGSHTWNALADGRHALDYSAYLDFLVQHNHNFMKFRAWDSDLRYSPLYYTRTGPGIAVDGGPKLDLNEFNQAHFDRMRQRIIAARDRGIYVMIMLFETEELNGDPAVSDPYKTGIWNALSPSRWPYHPYNKLNNINGIDGGNADNTAPARNETLYYPAITALREAYIRKVVDTTNDLDNVLFEIANEPHNGDPSATNIQYGSPPTMYGPLAPSEPAWQYHMINYLRSYESTKPNRHPVVMTIGLAEAWAGDDSSLYASPAEGISPGPSGSNQYRENPPAADGSKVVLTDPDHYGWIGWRGTRSWVWKSFVRGLNPIPLDSLPLSVPGNDGGAWGGGETAEIIQTRSAMGHTRAYADRMNLAAMVPRNDLSSTAFCLANPGSEYLVYQPDGGGFSVTLAAGSYSYEWFNAGAGAPAGTETVNTPGGRELFTPPFEGDAVLYLKMVAAASRR